VIESIPVAKTHQAFAITPKRKVSRLRLSHKPRFGGVVPSEAVKTMWSTSSTGDGCGRLPTQILAAFAEIALRRILESVVLTGPHLVASRGVGTLSWKVEPSVPTLNPVEAPPLTDVPVV
jgi:hypothetical protein